MESETKNYELTRRLQEHLNNNLSLIENLHSTQHDRLSQHLHAHVAHVPQAGPDETQLANQVTLQLSDICKRLPPSAIHYPYGPSKAMGLSNASLPPPSTPRLIVPTMFQESCTQITVNLTSTALSDTNSVPMEMYEDVPNSNPVYTSVDLESELSEFLESGPSLPKTSDDNNNSDQLLLMWNGNDGGESETKL